MTDEEFKKEVQDLVDLLNYLHLVKEKDRTKWLKREVRAIFLKLLSRV